MVQVRNENMFPQRTLDIGKIMTLHNIGLSVEYFTADFFQFSS